MLIRSLTLATTLTNNLKLRLSEDLTANARYNLERIDLLGGVVPTSTDTVTIRSRTEINFLPNNADIGGVGSGGTGTESSITGTTVRHGDGGNGSLTDGENGDGRNGSTSGIVVVRY